MAAVTFTSCEDVPAPYDYPGTGGNGGDVPAEGVYLDQSFASDLGDFQSFGTNSNITWAIDYSSACITGYKDYDGTGTKSNQAGVTYLVSPEVDLTNATKAHVEMNHALNYERGNINTNNALLISSDFTSAPTTATWVAIPYSTDGLGSSFTFVDIAANIPEEFIGKKVRLALRHTCTASQSSTWEVKTIAVKEGEVETGGSGDEPTPTPSEGTGEGTEASPYDVAKALAIIASGNIPSTNVYVSGTISSISEVETSTFGNATYNISVDGTTTSDQLIVYRGYYLGGSKFTSSDQIKVGDKVVVYGKLKLFYEKKEMDQGNKLISINGKKDETGGNVTPSEPTEPTGDNLLVNGDCETWNGSEPAYWKTTSTAGNASLSQSNDAHSGSYAISVGANSSSNKRLAYQETTLKAGTYKFSFYAKATTGDASQCRAGYVPVTDGKVGSYVYSTDYASLSNSTWTLVTYEFTLEAETTVCLVIMNPKTSNYATAQTILIDDASLVKTK